MRASSIQGYNLDGILSFVDEQPVRINVTFPIAFVVANKQVVTTIFWKRFPLLQQVCDGFQLIYVQAAPLGKFQVTNKFVSVLQFLLDIHSVARISSRLLHFLTLPDSTSRMACMVSSLRYDLDFGSKRASEGITSDTVHPILFPNCLTNAISLRGMLMLTDIAVAITSAFLLRCKSTDII